MTNTYIAPTKITTEDTKRAPRGHAVLFLGESGHAETPDGVKRLEPLSIRCWGKRLRQGNAVDLADVTRNALPSIAHSTIIDGLPVIGRGLSQVKISVSTCFVF